VIPFPTRSNDAVMFAKAQELGQFTIQSLTDATRFKYDLIKSFIQRAEKAGVVRLVGTVERQRNLYEVADVTAQEIVPAPKPEWSPERNMWNVMRQMPTFTPRDLIVQGATEATSVTEKDARDFCRMLSRIGYIKAVRKAVPGVRDPIYKLVRNTGPLPPRARRVAAVVDDNLGAFVHLPGADE
jgi:hypothetical protein